MYIRVDVPKEREKNDHLLGESIEYKLLEVPNNYYFGRIIKDNELKLLKKTGKTVIPLDIYNQFESKDELIEELSNLVGRTVELSVHKHSDTEFGDTVIVSLVPNYFAYQTFDKLNFVVRKNGSIIKRVPKYEEEPIEEYVKEFIQETGIYSWDIKTVKKIMEDNYSGTRSAK